MAQACTRGDLAAVRRLVAGGESIRGVDRADVPALHHAAGCTDTTLLAYLLDEGAPIDAQTPEGETALIRAAILDCPAAIRLLVARGAAVGVTMQTIRGRLGPLHAAAGAATALEAVRTLVRLGRPVDEPNELGVTPLMLAAEAGATDAARCLLEAGANPNAQTKLGETAAMFAARWGHASAVEVVLDAGAELAHRDHRARTLAHSGAAYQDTAVLRLLIARGLDCDSPDHRGRTPLAHAARDGHHENVQVLLGVDARALLPDQVGWLAVHHAIRHLRHDAAAVLLMETRRRASRAALDLKGVDFSTFLNTHGDARMVTMMTAIMGKFDLDERLAQLARSRRPGQGQAFGPAIEGGLS